MRKYYSDKEKKVVGKSSKNNDIMEESKKLGIDILESDAIINNTMGKEIMSKMFTINDVNIVIFSINGKYWRRAYDIASFLEYEDEKEAIRNYVSNSNKKLFKEIVGDDKTPHIIGGVKIDPETLFISDAGLFDLISHSKNLEAKELWEKITNEILPRIFRQGEYVHPPSNIELEKLKKYMYTEQRLSKYEGKSCVYAVYIGCYDDIHYVKFKERKKFTVNDIREYRKFFPVFNILKIWPTNAPKTAENSIKIDLQHLNKLASLNIKGLNNKKKRITKLAKLSSEFGLYELFNIIDDAVTIGTCVTTTDTNVVTSIKDLHKKHKDEIKALKDANKNIIKDLEMANEKNELIEEKNKLLEEKNKLLEETLENMRKRKNQCAK